ncbi:MAG: hypothetical protein ACE1ZO_07135, partial [Nitrospirales bacterium]
PKDSTANRLLKDKPNVRETVWVIENFQGEQQGMFKTCPEPTPKEGALSKAAGTLARGAYS